MTARISPTAHIAEFEKTLPFAFNDKRLLRQVFVHASFLNERGASDLGVTESNERLEFLGDSVLSAVVSRMLYDRHPKADEGELTRMRSRLVNREALSGLAVGLRLGDCMLLGKGERASGGSLNQTILSCAFEALIAAVYIDQGLGAASSLIRGLFSPLIDEAPVRTSSFDFKPRLQEIAQRVFRKAPLYRVVKEEGPPHKRVFRVEAVVNGQVMGAAEASKKKDAEQLAAEEAIRALKERFPETDA